MTGTYPGTRKYEGTGAGGFSYSTEPGGPEIGRVGSGLSDQLRSDMFADPDTYVGRRARIRAKAQFPSGAYRTPSLLAFHEDYPTMKQATTQPTFLQRGLVGQMSNPQWDSGRGAMSNIAKNIRSAYDRGDRFIREEETARSIAGDLDPMVRAQQAAQTARGIDPIVTDNLDKLMYRTHF